MSLVGPRPTLCYQVEQYDAFQWQRLKMLPGMTGLAQITGRNELSWPERIRLDVRYVRHWSFALDLRILARTAGAILEGAGTYADDLSKSEEKGGRHLAKRSDGGNGEHDLLTGRLKMGVVGAGGQGRGVARPFGLLSSLVRPRGGVCAISSASQRSYG